MEGNQELSPQAQSNLDRGCVRREQQLCVCREGELFSELRRLSYAYSKGPGAPGFAVLRSIVSYQQPPRMSHGIPDPLLRIGAAGAWRGDAPQHEPIDAA